MLARLVRRKIEALLHPRLGALAELASKHRETVRNAISDAVARRSFWQAGAAVASIRIELALLSKGFTLAVRARKLRTKPYIPKPEGDPSRVRAGFFTREEVEALCTHLDPDLADVVTFLFFSAWRVGEVRTLQWRATTGMSRPSGSARSTARTSTAGCSH